MQKKLIFGDRRFVIGCFAGLTIPLILSACGSAGTPVSTHTSAQTLPTPAPTVESATVSSTPAVKLTHCQTQCLSPAWSPDGKTIAYFSAESGIWLMDPDGKNQRRLTDQVAGWEPAWSPDGRQIAFAQVFGDSLYIAKADGSDVEKVNHLPLAQNFLVYAWSPDGKNLAWVAAEDMSIWLYSLERRETRLIAHNTVIRSDLKWIDASTILFLSEGADNLELDQARVDETESRRLMSLPIGSYDGSLSPDGTRIIYNTSDEGSGTRLWLMTIGVSDIQRLPPEGGYSPTWSPDGKRIAFVYPGEGEETHINVMNVDGSGWMDVTKHAGFSDRDPVWSPDGKRLAFVACGVSYDEGYEANDQIFVVDVP
jgi:Tol biopolymer transport system component